MISCCKTLITINSTTDCSIAVFDSLFQLIEYSLLGNEWALLIQTNSLI